jgi:hypothetical protein
MALRRTALAHFGCGLRTARIEELAELRDGAIATLADKVTARQN